MLFPDELCPGPPPPCQVPIRHSQRPLCEQDSILGPKSTPQFLGCDFAISPQAPSFASPPIPVGEDEARVVRSSPHRVPASSNSCVGGASNVNWALSWGSPLPDCDRFLSLLQESFRDPVPNSRPAILSNAGHQHYFVLGFFFANRRASGITASTLCRVSCTQALNHWLRRSMPDLSWSSIAISHNTPVSPHRDGANCPDSLTASFMLGSSKQGGLLLEDPRGATSMNDPTTGMQVSATCVTNFACPVLFSPQKLHASAPWIGDRWSITCYLSARWKDASNSDRARLLELGFPLPSVPSVPDCSSSCPSRRAMFYDDGFASGPLAARQVALANPSTPGLPVLWTGREPLLALWLGREALPKLPVKVPCPGHVLLVSLFDGIGCAPACLASLGVPFTLVSVELDEALAAAVNSQFHACLHWPDVETFSLHHLPREIRVCAWACVLVLGGSPCQGNSVLNVRRRGLRDPRTQLFHHVRRVADEAHLLWPHSPTIALLENVQSAPEEFWHAASRQLPLGPIFTNAVDFGHVSRPRAWCAWSSVNLCIHSVKPPASTKVSARDRLPSGVSVQWQGKPWPKSLHFDGGFAKASPEAFPCFTRAFPHPRDRCHRELPDTLDRFERDERAFPPHCYREEALLWSNPQPGQQDRSWRMPNPREKANMHGMPSVQAQHSAIGNSFRIPFLALGLTFGPCHDT